MSKYVSREKYERLKAAANSWMKESRILKNKLETIPELEEEIIHLEEENKKLKDNLNNGTFESDMISTLKNDNKKIQEKMETLKNQQKDMAESYQKTYRDEQRRYEKDNI